MSQQPFFSIITICRNEASNIHLTADSVIKQTYKNYEWLIIDGNSTDDTLKILQTYKKHIHLLESKHDKGIYAAMNRGIKKVNGCYIIFMNGGDFFANKHVLARVHRFIKNDKEKHGLYHGDGLMHHNQPNKLLPYWQRPSIYKHKKATDFSLYEQPLPHQCCFFKKNLFDIYGLYDKTYKVYGDLDFCMRSRRAKNIYMNFYVAVQNNNSWNERVMDKKANYNMFMELMKIRFNNYHLLTIIWFESIFMARDITGHIRYIIFTIYFFRLSFLHKPWRAFKKILMTKKK
ncbi:MAG: glycosyltransferase [Alphaproteobacteria bacterium]